MSRLDDSFDFKSDRYKQVRQQVEKDFENNRSHLAHLAATHVDEITSLSHKKETTAQDFEKLYTSLQKSRVQLIRLFLGSFRSVIHELTPEESENLKIFFAKKSMESEKKISRKSTFIEKQMGTFEKFMDFFFDGTNDNQRIIYRQFLNENYDFFIAQIAAKKSFAKRFADLFQEKENLLAFVVQYYSGTPSAKDPAIQAEYQQFIENLFVVQNKIWLASDQKQKDDLAENLLNLKKQLQLLAKN